VSCLPDCLEVERGLQDGGLYRGDPESGAEQASDDARIGVRVTPELKDFEEACLEGSSGGRLGLLVFVACLGFVI